MIWDSSGEEGISTLSWLGVREGLAADGAADCCGWTRKARCWTLGIAGGGGRECQGFWVWWWL